MSLANKLSIFRILLVPGFVVALLYYRSGESEWLRYLAVGLFGVGVLTDAVDGYVARAGNQASRLGSILDPAADKLFLVTAFLCLSLITTLPERFRLPAWVPILVLSRDLLIVFGWALVVLVKGEITAYPSYMGKTTTVFQMMTIIAVLLGWSFSRPILWAAMVFTVLSGIGYIRRGNRILNFPAAKPSG